LSLPPAPSAPPTPCPPTSPIASHTRSHCPSPPRLLCPLQEVAGVEGPV
jgi:hypothetical protein